MTPEGDYLVGAKTQPDAEVPAWRSWVIKLHLKGDIDTSFGYAGKREVFRSEADSTGTTRVMLQSRSGIVVGGGGNVLRRGKQFKLTRLTSSGQVDRRFGNNGKVTTIASPTAEAGMLTLKAIADGELFTTGAIDAHDGAGLQFVVVRYLEISLLPYTPGANTLSLGAADGVALLRV